MKYLLGFSVVLVSGVGFYWLVADADTVLENSVRYEPAVLLTLGNIVSKNNDSVTGEVPVGDGDVVGTDATGRALIKSSEQLISSIAENTTLTFTDTEKTSALDVTAGKVWSRIERALEQDEVYEVYTPTMVAAVRGTSFGTYVSDEEEKFVVGEGVVEVRIRGEESGISVAAGAVAEMVEGSILVRPITEAEKDVWYAEHMAADWQYGGSEQFELITAHREGFWFQNPGQLTVVGTGFNQLRKVEIDGELMPFVPVSDTELRVPWYIATKISEDSEVVIYLGDKTVLPQEVFFGDRQAVMDNLLF